MNICVGFFYNLLCVKLVLVLKLFDKNVVCIGDENLLFESICKLLVVEFMF